MHKIMWMQKGRIYISFILISRCLISVIKIELVKKLFQAAHIQKLLCMMHIFSFSFFKAHLFGADQSCIGGSHTVKLVHQIEISPYTCHSNTFACYNLPLIQDGPGMNTAYHSAIGHL